MAGGTITESIGEISNGTALYVEWKVQNFLSLPEEVGYIIHSPRFHFKGSLWYLRVYPNGQYMPYTVGYINIYLIKQNTDSCEHRVNYTIGMNKYDGNMYDSWHNENEFLVTHGGWGVALLVERLFVCNEKELLAPNGEVTFFCYLQETGGLTSDVSTQTELAEDTGECNKEEEEPSNADKITGAHTLAENLKNLLTDEEECDVTLKVQNREFKAHKAILVARSSAFRSMFQHEMTEKLSNEVHITDCDPNAFWVFLTYLYTGEAEDLSSSNVFTVYTIANKYDAEELQMKCIDFLTRNLTVETVCDVIAFSLLHSDSVLLQEASKFFIKYLKDIVFTVKWLSFLREHPTAANELLIKASKYYNPPE